MLKMLKITKHSVKNRCSIGASNAVVKEATQYKKNLDKTEHVNNRKYALSISGELTVSFEIVACYVIMLHILFLLSLKKKPQTDFKWRELQRQYEQNSIDLLLMWYVGAITADLHRGRSARPGRLLPPSTGQATSRGEQHWNLIKIHYF